MKKEEPLTVKLMDVLDLGKAPEEALELLIKQLTEKIEEIREGNFED